MYSPKNLQGSTLQQGSNLNPSKPSVFRSSAMASSRGVWQSGNHAARAAKSFELKGVSEASPLDGNAAPDLTSSSVWAPHPAAVKDSSGGKAADSGQPGLNNSTDLSNDAGSSGHSSSSRTRWASSSSSSAAASAVSFTPLATAAPPSSASLRQPLSADLVTLDLLSAAPNLDLDLDPLGSGVAPATSEHIRASIGAEVQLGEASFPTPSFWEVDPGTSGQNVQQPQSGIPPAFGPLHQAQASESSLLRCSVFDMLPAVGFGGSLIMAASVDELPTNETEELSRRLVSGHRLLQSLYEASDATVQHRQAQAAASKSITHARAAAPRGAN